MKTIRYIYKTGYGPSSSHTMGPAFACEKFLQDYPNCDGAKTILYGSLSKTGRGHGTDTIIRKCFQPIPVEIVFNNEKKDLPHPNTMDLIGYEKGKEVAKIRVMSVGGGSIVYENGSTETE